MAAPAIFTTAVTGLIIASGNDYLHAGDQTGKLYALDRDMHAVCTVVAYKNGRITHLLACSNHLLATIGDEETDELTLKVWELTTTKKEVVNYHLLSTLKIQSDQPYPITCCTALEDLSHVAIGFSDGRVVLVKGDLARDRGAKQRAVYEGEEPITGLEFLVSNKVTVLYIFSTSKLLTLTVSNATGRSVTQVPRVMESVGAALGCVAKDKSRNEIFVARDDALYRYNVDGRGPCYALEGRKTSLNVHQSYSVLVQPSNERKWGPMKVLGKLGIPDLLEYASKVTVLDSEHKFISHVGQYSQGLRSVFSQWDNLYLLTTDGKLFRLAEIDVQSRLEILYSKSLFPLALSLAEAYKLDESQTNIIRLKYADYLYVQAEYEPAVRQYIQAIRQCDTSAIMRKYLEAQHVPLLTEFLEALHTAKLSNSDYTTLLLNCYAKLQQREKLRKFIHEEGQHPIDLQIAVALCRQAGYFDEAVSITAKHKSHVLCLGITIEDKKDYRAALTYIRKLTDPGDVGILLNNFGRELMSHLPQETTKLFTEFYTGSFVPETHIQATGVLSPPRRAVTGYGGALYDSMINNRYAQVLPSLPALDMSQFNPMRRTASVAASVLSKESSLPEYSDLPSTIAEKETEYTVPKPRTAFPIFVDFPQHFIMFLEVMLERQVDDDNDQNRKDIVSALLEVYLKQSKDSSGEAKTQWQNKAKDLLTKEADYVDNSNALLLFHLTPFDEGSIMIQERADRKEDVFRSYCMVGDTRGVIKMMHKYGEDEPQLYILALKYFISDTQKVADAGPELGVVLSKIQEKKLLAPLQVVQTLSSNAVATVGTVKGYLSDIIARERKEINANQSLIESYKAETEAKQKEARELAENARVLQVSRCSRCNATLELPVIHFLCKHSYHQHCLPSAIDDFECPLCEESNNAVKAVVLDKLELAEKQDFFKERLAASRDKANFLFSRLDLNLDQVG